MKNLWLKILLTIAALIIIGIIGLFILIKLAFGTSTSSYEIDLGDDKKLFGTESYSADFADVFYGAHFNLLADNDTFCLGSALFIDQPNWRDSLKLFELDDWFVLQVSANPLVEFHGVSKNHQLTLDTTLVPQYLRKDTVFSKKYQTQVPMWDNDGLSRLDSVKNNFWYVSYTYKDNYHPPMNYFKLTVSYLLNSKTGKLETQHVYDREIIKHIAKKEEPN